MKTLNRTKTLNKINPLLKSEIIENLKTYESIEKFMEKATDRIDYIVSFINKAFNANIAYWFFSNPDVENYEVYDFFDSINLKENLLGFNFSMSGNKKLVANIRFGENDQPKKFIINDGYIPLDWLYSDFEEELLEGIKRQEEIDLNNKIASEKNKKDKEDKEAKVKNIAESALNKLTQEEVKALRKILHKIKDK